MDIRKLVMTLNKGWVRFHLHSIGWWGMLNVDWEVSGY